MRLVHAGASPFKSYAEMPDDEAQPGKADAAWSDSSDSQSPSLQPSRAAVKQSGGTAATDAVSGVGEATDDHPWAAAPQKQPAGKEAEVADWSASSPALSPSEGPSSRADSPSGGLPAPSALPPRLVLNRKSDLNSQGQRLPRLCQQSFLLTRLGISVQDNSSSQGRYPWEYLSWKIRFCGPLGGLS